MTTARTLLTAVLFVIGFSYSQKTWADTSVISNGVDGWSKITALPANLGDYYFVFVDDSRDLMLSFEDGYNQSTTDGYKTMVYRTSKNPVLNPAMLWEISTNNADGGTNWSIKSAVEPTYYMQTEWNDSEKCRTHDQSGANNTWCKWNIAYADNKWTIQNGKYPENGYVGPWTDAAFSNGMNVAANKSGGNIGYFQIYSILRSAVDLTGVLTASPSNPFNYTYKITNPNAAHSAYGWTMGDGTGRNNGTGTFDGINGFFEPSKWGNNSFNLEMSQSISGLPAGKFRVRAAIQSSSACTVTLKANENSSEAFAGSGTSDGSILQTGEETTAGNGVAGWKWRTLDFIDHTGTINIAFNTQASAVHNWANVDNVELYMLAPYATSASNRFSASARQWYAITVGSTAEYRISSSGATTIYYTQTDIGTSGYPNVSTITHRNVSNSNPIGPITLSAGTLYVYSSADVTLSLYSVPATASDMSDLSSAISNHPLGFDNGEYAPYNNLDGVTILAEANAVDTSNPVNYAHDYIAGLVSAINNATWTANVGEVNAIYWLLDGTVYTSGSESAATGFTNNSDTGRLRVSANPSSNSGLNNVSPTMALWLRFGNSTTYGTTTGYTMPLKASTFYKMTFKYGGWGDSSGTPTITVNNPNGTAIATKTLADVAATHNANNWTPVTIYFETDVAGDYTWSTTSQDGHRPAYAELNIVRATIADILDYYSTKQMNAGVKEAMVNAYTAYSGSSTAANLSALVSAIEAAENSVAEYNKINTLLTELTTANQRGGISEVNAKAMSFYTKYSDGVVNGSPDANTGTYTTLSEVIPLYRTNVSTYWNAHAATNANMTAFIVNQGFEMGDLTGWTLPKGSSSDTGVKSNAGGYATTGMEGSSLFHTSWQGKPLQQILSGMPDGTYRLTVSLASSDADKDAHVYLAAQDEMFKGRNDITKNTSGTAHDYTLDFVAGNEDCAIKVIGGNGDGTYTSDGYWWYRADDFRLTYLGSGVVGFSDPADDVDTSKPMNAAERTEYTTARTAYTGAKTATNYVRLVKAREVALVSIDAYEDAKNALDSLQALMTNTNVYTYEAYSTLYGHYEKSKTMYDNETMGDTYASNLYKEFFGNRGVGQKPVPVVPFLASAWMEYEQTSNSDYSGYSAEDGNFHCNTWSVEGDTHDYWVPFMEYWSGSALTSRTLQATVKTTTGSSTLSLTGKLRVMTDGSAPTNIKMRIYSERAGGVWTEYSNGTGISNGTITWTRVGTTNFYVAQPTITGAYADEVDENGDGLYDLHIQFVVETGTNVSWLAFKNLKYTGTGVDLSAIRALNTALGAAIAAADSHKLGFSEDEYAPYTNVEQLVAKTNAEAYKTIIQSLLNEYDAVPRTKTAEQVIAGVNYALSNYALRALQTANTSWTQNAEEMNGIYWTSDYTTDDIKDFVMYDDEGTHAFRTIEPSGWDLAGRHDAYSTRMNKLGVNTTQDTGLVGVPDSTCLMIKFDTNYGEQPGYTLPLLPNTKYALVFLYTNWEDRDKDIRKQVDITIENSTSNSFVTPSVTYYQVAENEKGNFDAQYWKLYTATFTTQADYGSDGKYDNYVITFTKNRAYTGLGGNGQLQVAMADFYLLRCLDDYTLTANGLLEASTANVGDNGLSFKLNNGSAGALSAPPSLSVTNVALKRTFNEGAWNSFVLPFNMTQSEATAAFNLGEDTRICYYVGATFDDDEYMACRLRFKSRPCGIMANVPIIIMGNAANATKWDGSDAAHTLKENLVVLKMPSAIWNGTAQPLVVDGRPGAAQGYDDVVEGDKTPIYNYVGTYRTTTIPKHGVYFTNSTDNTYKKSTAGTTRLRPTRAYFKDMTVDENGESHVKLANFSVDDIETGIMAIEEDGSLHDVTGNNIYSLDGKLVRRNATTLDGLKKGLYIMDGKKYLVR